MGQYVLTQEEFAFLSNLSCTSGIQTVEIYYRANLFGLWGKGQDYNTLNASSVVLSRTL